MTKRSNGEGSIYYEKTRKKYSASFIDPFGKRIHKRFSTEKEARMWLKGEQADVVYGTYVKSNRITLTEWMNTFVDTFKQNVVKETTIKNYELFIGRLGTYGECYIQDLSLLDFQKLINSLGSISAKKRMKAVLATAFDRAVKSGLVKSNPARLIEIQKSESKEIKVFSDEEIRQLYLIYNRSKVWTAMLTLALATGMRKGEVIGLQIGDVSANKISVKHSLEPLGTHDIILTTPKTKNSVREVPIGKEVYKLLEEVIDGRKEGFVFTQNNKPILPNTFQTTWRRNLVNHNMERKGFHSIRHTFATRLLAEGVPVANVSKLLGHKHTSFTYNTYVHVSQKHNENITEIIGKAMNFEVVAPQVAPKSDENE